MQKIPSGFGRMTSRRSHVCGCLEGTRALLPDAARLRHNSRRRRPNKLAPSFVSLSFSPPPPLSRVLFATSIAPPPIFGTYANNAVLSPTLFFLIPSDCPPVRSSYPSAGALLARGGVDRVRGIGYAGPSQTPTTAPVIISDVVVAMGGGGGNWVGHGRGRSTTFSVSLSRRK